MTLNIKTKFLKYIESYKLEENRINYEKEKKN